MSRATAKKIIIYKESSKKGDVWGILSENKTVMPKKSPATSLTWQDFRVQNQADQSLKSGHWLELLTVVCFAHLQEDVREDNKVINICIWVWVSGRGGLVWTAGSEESCWYVWDAVAYWHHPHTPTHLWPVLLPLVLVRLMDQNVTVYSNRKKGGHIFGIQQIWWKNNKLRIYLLFCLFLYCRKNIEYMPSVRL